ncbi:MAG: iron ABC transporter substrate-binding protein, partial [Methylobacterium sp.]
NQANAQRLVEWLLSPAAQAIYAEQNHEYPVLAGIEPNDFLKSLGTLKADRTPLETIGKNRKAASELVDKVGFNLGPQS